MREVRFCSQWAMVESGTMAPFAVAPVVAGAETLAAGAAAAELEAAVDAEDDEPVPERVPD